MKKLFRVLTLLLLISFISPYGYSSEIVRVKNIKSDKPIYRPIITEVLKLINEEGDQEYWYGVYLDNEKNGWLNFRSKIYESEKFDQEVFEIVADMNIGIKDLGNDGKLVIMNFIGSSTEIYQARAPFRLISYYEKFQMDDTTSSIFGEKQGYNFKLEYKDNNEKNVREVLLTNFNYSLFDMLAIDAWFRKKPPKVDDMVASRTFDFQTLEYILNETTIQEIVKSKVSGVDYIYYKANSLDKAEIEEEDLTSQFLIDQDGIAIKFFMADLELRLESEKNAKKINKVSYVEMLEMSSMGTKVLQTRSVELAMKNNLTLQVLSSLTNTEGTYIVNENKLIEKEIVSGVSYSKNESKITISGIPDKPGISAKIFGLMASNNINVDMIVQNISQDGVSANMTFTVLTKDIELAKKTLERNNNELNYTNLSTDSNIAKISVIGMGMMSQSGVAEKMFKTLADKLINILAISTSEIKISVLIDKKYTDLAVKTLHSVYKLANK